jgi:hypothetical protein
MKPHHRILITVVTVGLIGCAVVIDGSENVLARAMALNSVFTGLLTLTGFMFTARTFITFKLNEVVYGKPEYRQRVEELQADGAYQQKLYEPLRSLDATVGRTCLLCFGTLFCVLTFSFLPREWSKLGTSLFDICKAAGSIGNFWTAISGRFLTYQVATVSVFSVVFLIIVEVFSAIMSVNRNIRSIISEWEENYNKEKAMGKNKPPSG